MSDRDGPPDEVPGWLRRATRFNVWISSIVLAWMLVAVLSIPFRVADIRVPAYVGLPLWVLSAVGIHRVIADTSVAA